MPRKILELRACESFGKQLRTQRKAQKIKQSALERQLECAQGHLSHFENDYPGFSNSIPLTMRYAKALGFTHVKFEL